MAVQNNNRAEVLELQNMLRAISQADGSIPLINPDGIFGPKTEEAVIAFQTDAGLPPSGIVDYATWNAIFRAYQNASHILSHRAIQPFPSPNYEIHSGEKTDLVLLIQIMLSALAIAMEIFDDIALTGIYDETTEKAVTEFQRLHHLTANGVIDHKTWDELARSYNHIAQNTLYSD